MVERKSHPPGRSVETVPLFEEVKCAQDLVEVTAAVMQEKGVWGVAETLTVMGSGKIKIKDYSGRQNISQHTSPNWKLSQTESLHHSPQTGNSFCLFLHPLF